MNARMRCAAWLVVGLLTGCGGGGGDEDSKSAPPAPPPPPAAVAVGEGFVTPTVVRSVAIAGQEVPVADRQVVIVLSEDVSNAQFDALVERMRALGAQTIGARRDMRLMQITVASNAEAAAITGLQDQPGVEYAGYSFVVETTRANTRRSVDATARSAIDGRRSALAAAASDRYWANHIELESAQAVETQLGITSGPRIAVVDTGLPADQDVIAAPRVTRVDAQGAALSGDSTSDVKSHGLQVSAFAAGNTSQASGVSRFSTLLMVDVYRDQCTGIFSVLGCPFGLGRVFLVDLAEGIRTAVNSDARVINVSWGDASTCSNPSSVRVAARQAFRAIHSAAVNLARRKDKLMFFSAGNNCEKRDDQLLARANDPAADSWRSHALIVGASTSAKKDAPFSRMGAVVDLMAPGQAISYGQAAVDGTSFSTPLATGGGALVLGISPQLSAPEARYLLVSGAEASIGFIDAGALAYRGYAGANATGPSLLLNLGNSAQAAKLTREAVLQTLDAVPLAKAARKTVNFDVEMPATGVRALDVVFVIDVSGSYGDDIETLRSSAGQIVDALLARGIDVQFAVSEFADFPVSNFGDSGDIPYRRITRMTSNRASVLAGINQLFLRSGYDEPESQLEALYQVATGAGRDINGDGSYDIAVGDVEPSPVGFRTGAAKVVLFATDAPFHDRDREPAYPGAGFAETAAALKSKGIRVIALQSGTTSSAASDIARLVSATGGASYQLSTNSAQIATAIAAGVSSTLGEVEITAEKIAGAEWIKSITQDKKTARPGEKVRFTVELEGQKSESIDRLTYDLYLWVRGNGSALIQRVKIPVEVTR